STDRWESTAASGVASIPASITLAYAHQFLLSIAANPQDGGTTSMMGGPSQWISSGSTIPLVAQPGAGFSCVSWTTSNPRGIEFSDSSAASTTATINGPGSVTAGFAVTAFPVTFVESGLPAGMTWSVTADGRTASSHTATF